MHCRGAALKHPEPESQQERTDRILRMAAQLELFRRATGHEPASVSELRDWLELRKAAVHDPASVLTREQIVEALHDCLREG